MSVWKERKKLDGCTVGATHIQEASRSQTVLWCAGTLTLSGGGVQTETPAVAILPTVFLVPQTLGIVHVASTQLLENHPVLIMRNLARNLAFPNLLHFQTAKKKKKSRCLPLPFISMCLLICSLNIGGTGFLPSSPLLKQKVRGQIYA